MQICSLEEDIPNRKKASQIILVSYLTKNQERISNFLKMLDKFTFFREYMTGFQKLNKEKKKKYLEKQKELLHQEKVEKRREVFEYLSIKCIY